MPIHIFLLYFHLIKCLYFTDVFHWSCLDHYARQLPPNTAPAGYTCPICKSGIFPAHNVVSPVADVLRQILIKVNWARVGLGLPLVFIYILCFANNNFGYYACQFLYCMWCFGSASVCTMMPNFWHARILWKFS